MSFLHEECGTDAAIRRKPLSTEVITECGDLLTQLAVQRGPQPPWRRGPSAG
ncbi:hypothetical protein [Streptomyces sp. NPDC051286]|uniref:hypothetical protein n=1 Tax=Streptomyces sp. NPDC051286 TaxID=3365647 RepID=UPI00379FF168